MKAFGFDGRGGGKRQRACWEIVWGRRRGWLGLSRKGLSEVNRQRQGIFRSGSEEKRDENLRVRTVASSAGVIGMVSTRLGRVRAAMVG